MCCVRPKKLLNSPRRGVKAVFDSVLEVLMVCRRCTVEPWMKIQKKTRLPSGPLQEGCEPREITYKVVFLNMSLLLLLLLLWWNNSGAKKKSVWKADSIQKYRTSRSWDFVVVLRPWRVFSFRLVERKCAEYKYVCLFLFRSSFWRFVQIREVFNLAASIGCSRVTFRDM